MPSTVSFDELIRAFAEAEHSRLPVYGESLDEILGMIHIKDVFVANVDRNRDRSIEGLMRTPLFVPESMGVIDLLARMRAERTHLAIVIDEFGGTEGLVTIEDVVEEIVGEIEDEHDEEAPGMLIPLEDGLWEADARAELEEVAATIDRRLAAAAQAPNQTYGQDGCAESANRVHLMTLRLPHTPWHNRPPCARS